MSNSIDEKVLELLKGDELDDYWRCKVINSVYSINIVFKTRVTPTDIHFCKLEPEQLWVNCEEEINLLCANTIESTLSVQRLAPITVIEYNGKHTIYMGSVRAVLFCRYQKTIDCIVVVVHTEKAAFFSNQAQRRLIDFDIYR